RIADGEESIDLMDRADGGSRRHVPPAGAETDFPDGFDEWIVIQPWISAAANCVVPKEIMAANVLGGPSGDTFSYVSAFCPTGNPAGGRGTVRVPMPDGQGGWVTRTYRMATDAPNGGA